LDLYDPTFLTVLTIGLLLTGAIAGVLAGLLGVGGGIVIVPVLYLLFDGLNLPEATSMHLAVGTSLATIIPTSIVDLDVLRVWAPFVFIGAGLGGFLARYLSSSMLTAVFGVIALAVAINMILPKKVVLSDSLPTNKAARSGIASAIGLFSAWMGIGGGTLSVPLLTMFSYPVHRAVGTAAAFGFFIAVPAVVGFIAAGWNVAARPLYSFGYVSIPAAVLIFSMSIFTAPVGSKLAHMLDAGRLRRMFALFLFLTALRMLYKVFF